MATRTKPSTTRKATGPRKSTVAKTVTRRGTAPEPKRAKTTPMPVAELPTSAIPDVVARKRAGDLLNALDERSPLRRADLKAVMELVLDEMGKLVDAGDELVLPPLGKLSVKKRVSRNGRDILTVKLKRGMHIPPSPTKD